MIKTNSARIENIVNAIITQFRARTVSEGRKLGINYNINLDVNVDDSLILWLHFSKENEKHSINIPLPYEKDGVLLINQNEVVRAVCNFWMEETQKEFDYFSTIYEIILGSPKGLLPEILVKKTSFMQQMIHGFENNNASIISYKFQKAINKIIHGMPLHETNINSYVLNNRLMVIDEVSFHKQRIKILMNNAKKRVYRIE